MTLRRRIDTLGPPLLAAAAIAVLVAPALAGPARSRMLGGHAPIRAASAPETLPACRPGAKPDLGEGARLNGAAWYRLDPILDAAGGLDGQRLVVGRVGHRGGFELALGVESFASGPSGGRILVGSDDGRRSIVRIVDVNRRCAAVVHEGRELIRRAVFDTARGGIVEFRLDRATRADRGVWSRPADGAKPTQLLEPLVANDRIGRVFATALTWSTDGRRLVVTSCGEAACLILVLDRGTGRVTTIDDPRIGEVIGLVGDDLVAYRGCPGLPCDVVAMDLRTGDLRGIAKLAGLAAVSSTAGVGVVAFEDYTTRGRLDVMRVDGTAVRTLPLEEGLRLVPGSNRALAAIELPAGVIALARGSRPSRALAPATFINLADGRRLPAAEVVP
jgi:hypothetical protein